MRVASSIAAETSVDASLDDFIARANATLMDMGGWGLGDDAAARAHEEEVRRRVREAAAREATEAAEATAAEQRAALEAAAARRESELEDKIAALSTRIEALEAELGDATARAEKAEATAETSARAAAAATADKEAATAHAKDEVKATETAGAGELERLQKTLDETRARAREADKRARSAESKAARAVAMARSAAAGKKIDKKEIDKLARNEARGENDTPAATAVEAEDRPGRIAWLPVAGAFAAGLLVMLGVDMMTGDKAGTTAGDTAAADQAGDTAGATSPTPALIAPQPAEAPGLPGQAPAEIGAGQADLPGLAPAAAGDSTTTPATGLAAGAAAGSREPEGKPEVKPGVKSDEPAATKPAVARAEEPGKTESQPKARSTRTTRTTAKTADKPAKAEDTTGIVDPVGGAAAKKEPAKKPARKKPAKKEPAEKTPPAEKKPTGIVDPFAS